MKISSRLLSPNIEPSVAPDTRLGGRWLLVARVVWLVFALGLLASFIASIPANYAQLHHLCADPKAICASGQPTPGNLLALQRLGLSLDAYAFFNVGINVGISLVFLGVGTLVYWRRSSDWLGLSVSFSLVLFGSFGGFGSLASSLLTPGVPLVLSVFIQVMSNLEVPAIGLFLVIFPTGRFTPRWTWL